LTALTESTVLAALGVVGRASRLTKDAGGQPDAEGAPEAAIDGRSAFSARPRWWRILFGLAPALRATRVDLTRDLRESERSGVSPGLGRALVIAQIALSLVLLVGAGLFPAHLRNLAVVETGLAADGVQLFKVHAIASGEADSLGLSRRLLERFQALPGVRAVGVSAHQLVGDTTDRTRVAIEGREPASGGAEFALVNRVGGDFFAALGIPVRAGRAIGPQDDVGAPPAIVINEAFGRVYFPERDPVGRRVNGAEVVGVTADTRYGALRDPPPPTMFVPAFQQAAARSASSARWRRRGPCPAAPPGRPGGGAHGSAVRPHDAARAGRPVGEPGAAAGRPDVVFRSAHAPARKPRPLRRVGARDAAPDA
jgi:hypothetical protein